MKINRFSTNRLTIRDWQTELGDAERRRSLEAALVPILTEPVLKHLPGPLQLGTSNGAVSAWITSRSAEASVSQILLTQTDTLIGLLILAREPKSERTETIHLGYLFAEAAWRQGYATELLAGLVVTAKSVPSIRLVAGVGKDNPASAQVLRKAGFRVDPVASGPDTDIFVHQAG
jgi:RimJ/RimL family protein N-acetyltransferase